MTKKLTLFTAILMLFASLSFAQNQTDSITVKKKGVYLQNGKILKPKELLEITKNNPEAYALMKKAQTNYAFANVFSFTGGFMIGWQLGSLIGGGEANWGVAGAGAGTILIAIPFSSAYIKHSQNAVDLYNADLSKK